MLSLASIGLRLLGWGSSLLTWLRSLPWYVLALIACLLIIVVERHEWTSAEATVAKQAKELATDRADLAGYQHDLVTDGNSIKELESDVSAQNAAVDQYKAAASAAQQSAALARAQADTAAQGRAAAIAELKAAQTKPVADDCAAPSAHDDVKGQL